MKKLLIYIVIIILLIICAWFPAAAVQRSLVKGTEKNTADIILGKQYLLIMGIGAYQQFPPLLNPVLDAREIREILATRYYFDEIIELYDAQATKRKIIEVFSQLQNQLCPQDSLLIYYAGHGYFDPVTNSGFLIPVNGGTDVYEQRNWLSHAQICGLIAGIKATHLCLIADSCFSGNILDLSRGISVVWEDLPALKKSYSLTSRQVITAGSMETVPDDSEFTRQLKHVLQTNTQPLLDIFNLYNQIRQVVHSTTPLLGFLKNTGHQPGAAFILFLKQPGQEEITLLETSFSPAAVEDYPIRPGTNGLTISWNAGVLLPLGDITTILEPSFFPAAGIAYRLNLGSLICLIGLSIGLHYEQTLPDFYPAYILLSLPLQGVLHIRGPAASRFFGFTEVTAGGTISFLNYQLPGVPGARGMRFCLGLAAGGGYRVSSWLNLALATEFTTVYYNDHIYTALAPRLGLELIY